MHPLTKFKNGIVDQGVDENYNLETFDMIVTTNEVAKELVNIENNFQAVSS